VSKGTNNLHARNTLVQLVAPVHRPMYEP